MASSGLPMASSNSVAICTWMRSRSLASPTRLAFLRRVSTRSGQRSVRVYSRSSASSAEASSGSMSWARWKYSTAFSLLPSFSS